MKEALPQPVEPIPNAVEDPSQCIPGSIWQRLESGKSLDSLGPLLPFSFVPPPRSHSLLLASKFRTNMVDERFIGCSVSIKRHIRAETEPVYVRQGFQ